jgi:ribosome-binding factor A
MTDRNIRVTSVIQELAAKYIQLEANTDPLITITSAQASPDFKYVTIFFTTIPEGKEKDAHIFLKRNGSEFRNYIKKHGRFKTIPHIDFEVDFGERHRQHIDDMVRQIADGKEN